MRAEEVALVPRCAECGARWLPADEERWHAFLTIDDEVAFYCPACGEERVAATAGIVSFCGPLVVSGRR